MKTLILDGIWGRHARWEPLRRRIEREVGACHIWRYDNTGLTSLEELGLRLGGEIRKLDAPVRLIGYSMGGLVIREALRQGPDLPLDRSVFLHSPHGGSWAAHLLPLPACRDMRPGSAFLQRLAAMEWKTPTLATWCPWDLMILPGRSARWHQASHLIRSDMPAHAWPVISPAIHKTVVRFLKE